jgi:hypothetical protein
MAQNWWVQGFLIINFLLNTKYQVNFDYLIQLHMLDKIEKDKDMSCKCCKVVDYCKEKGDDHRNS